MTKRILTLALAAIMTAALFIGGGQSAFAAENGSTEEITVGIASDLDSSLDPHVSSSLAGTREVLFNIYEGLLKPDTQGNLIPAVAEDYSASDTADEYTFILRKGVRFHDGSEVTVGDVVYSLTRAAGLDTGEPLVATLAGIASVEAVGDDTVVVKLSAPDAEFPAYMTVAIIPEGSDPADGIIGTGPFKYVSRSPQENVIIERFDDYWGEPAKCSKVTFKIVDDSQAMVMGLHSGAIDLAARLDASQAAELSELNVLEGSMKLVQAVYLNNARPPFDDFRVRQALCYAIDKYMVIDLACDGHGTALGSSMYPAFGRFFDEGLTDYYEPDMQKAVELLTEAGYSESNPLKFTIAVVEAYTPHMNTAQAVVDLLRQTGMVEAEIQPMENATWKSVAYEGREFDATITGLEASTLTASAMLSRFVSDNAKNFIGFDNADYDAAYAAAVSTTDPDEQTAQFKECERILTENAANVYIQDLADFVVTQTDIEGYQFYPLYVMDMSTVSRVQ